MNSCIIFLALFFDCSAPPKQRETDSDSPEDENCWFRLVQPRKKWELLGIESNAFFSILYSGYTEHQENLSESFELESKKWRERPFFLFFKSKIE